MNYCDAAPQTTSDWGIIRAPIWNIHLYVPVFVHKSLFCNAGTTFCFSFKLFLYYSFIFFVFNARLSVRPNTFHAVSPLKSCRVISMLNVGWKGPFLSEFSNNVWKQKKCDRSPTNKIFSQVLGIAVYSQCWRSAPNFLFEVSKNCIQVVSRSTFHREGSIFPRLCYSVQPACYLPLPLMDISALPNDAEESREHLWSEQLDL